MSKENRLETEKISSLLISFSVPAVIGMLVTAIYNIVDRIFIGNAPNLGALGLAAVSITFPVTLALLAFSLMIGIGGATRFSISLGRKEPEKAERYLANAVLLSIIAGLLFTVFGNLFLEPLLVLLGASADVLAYAEEYLSTILYGAVFQCTALVLNDLARADGSPRVSMVSMMIGAGFNILFDYIFIVLLGMGMQGAALATIGGQFLSMVWQLVYFFGSRSTIKLVLSKMKLKIAYAMEILSTGTPAFLLQIANSLMIVILNSTLVAYGGDLAVSVAGIILSAATLVLMMVVGLSQGLQPIISYNTGAERPDRVGEAMKVGSIIATILSTAGFVFIQLFPEAVISIFNQDPQLIALGVPAIRIWTIAFPVIGLQIIRANYFQAVGDVRLASFLNLTRQVIFLIPLILILSSIFGLYGIYAAVPLADFSAFLMSSFFYRRQAKKRASRVM